MTTDGTKTDGPVAGWYPDPLEQADLRWFDGTTWTEQTREHPATAAAGSAAQSTSEPTGDDAATGDATPAPKPAAGELTDAELLALIAAEDRRRRIIFGVVGLLVVVAAAWLLFGRGDDAATDDASQAPPAAQPDASQLEEGVQGRVEGTAPTPPADPTASQQAAQAAAIESIERIVRGVETCAVGNEDGSYAGCTKERVLEVAPSLRPLLDACGSAGGGCIRLIGTTGYEVKVQDTAQPPRTWTEIHTIVEGGDDNVTRTCEPAGCTPTGSWDPDEAG